MLLSTTLVAGLCTLVAVPTASGSVGSGSSKASIAGVKRGGDHANKWTGLHGPSHAGSYGASCLNAEELNAELKPKVDCRYTFTSQHGDSFLWYHIKISATGQRSDGWAKGVLDNIVGECGSRHLHTNGHHSGPVNRDRSQYYKQTNNYGLAVVNDTTYNGLEMSVALSHWSKGEDEVPCMTEAIKKASCEVNLDFKNRMCYQMPDNVNEELPLATAARFGPSVSVYSLCVGAVGLLLAL